MIGIIIWTVVGSIGLFAVGHILPGTKPHCRRVSKKMWRYTGKRAQQAWRANREAKRRRRQRRIQTDPKARERDRRRTARRTQPPRLTIGHRPEDGKSVADRLDTWRTNRHNRRTATGDPTQPQPQPQPRNRGHGPQPQPSGGSSECGARTRDGTPCRRLVNADGKCGIKSHDSSRRPGRRPRSRSRRSTTSNSDGGGQTTPAPRVGSGDSSRRPPPTESRTSMVNVADGNAVVGFQANVVGGGGGRRVRQPRPPRRSQPSNPSAGKSTFTNVRSGNARIGRQVDRHDGDLEVNG